MNSTKLDQTQCLNRTVLSSTIAALLASGGAAAQAPDAGLEEITITGSRIVRRDLDAASPIVTIDTERLENSSTISIESVLNQMPQFVPEGTQFDQGIQAGPTATLGIGSVNLRGIGSNRTLVLIDGRRAQPANAALIIDVNTIPSAAIERVETITGGASACTAPTPWPVSSTSFSRAISKASTWTSRAASRRKATARKAASRACSA
jgi:outer membrane receptor for ferrienterochelin and colicin